MLLLFFGICGLGFFQIGFTGVSIFFSKWSQDVFLNQVSGRMFGFVRRVWAVFVFGCFCRFEGSCIQWVFWRLEEQSCYWFEGFVRSREGDLGCYVFFISDWLFFLVLVFSLISSMSFFRRKRCCFYRQAGFRFLVSTFISWLIWASFLFVLFRFFYL